MPRGERGMPTVRGAGYRTHTGQPLACRSRPRPDRPAAAMTPGRWRAHPWPPPPSPNAGGAAPTRTRYAAPVKLNDRGSGRVVDTLLREPLPINPRGLPVKLGVEPATVGKLLVNLDRDGLIERAEASLVTVVHRRALLQQWSEDYSYVRSNRRMGWFIAPRGLPTLFRHLARDEKMSATGSMAARRALPPAVARDMSLHLAALFAPDPAGLAARLGLIKVGPDTANVVIAAPFDPILLTGGTVVDGVRHVTIGRALVDLLTLPDPAPVEAEQIMDHLAIADSSWG